MKNNIIFDSLMLLVLLTLLIPLNSGCRKKQITERIDYNKKSTDKPVQAKRNDEFPALAEELLKKQDFDGLYSLIVKELKNSDGDSLVYSYLGVYFQVKKQGQKAREAFEKALKMNPYNELAKEELSNLILKEARMKAEEISDPEVFRAVVADLKTACSVHPGNKETAKFLSEIYYLKGEEFFKKDGLKEARDFLEKSLEYNNSSYNSVITLSQIELKERGKQGLYLLLNDIKKKYPDNKAPDAIFREIKYDEDKLESGEDFFNDIREKKDIASESFEKIKSTSLFEQGTYYLEKKRWSKAVDCFSKALTVNPGNSREIYYYLAKAYFSLGLLSNARFYLDELKKQGELDLDQSLLGIDIDIKNKKNDESLVTLKELMSRYPDNEGIKTRIFEIHLAKGEYPQVIAELEKILSAYPNNSNALELMGLAYAKQGNYDSALPYWNRLLIIEPDSAKTYYNKGIIDVKRRNFMEAIINFSLATKFEPENPLYIYSLGLTFRQNGMIKESTEIWTDLLKRFPSSKFAGRVDQIIKSDSGSMDMLANTKNADFSDANKIFQEGFISLKIGEYDQARKSFEKVLKINPENIYSNKAMSELMGKTGSWVEELAYGLKTLMLDPKENGVHKFIGQGYMNLGLTSDAKPYLTKAVSFNDMDMEVLKTMASCHLLDKEEELARKYIARISSIYGGTAMAQNEINSIADIVRNVSLPSGREEIMIRKRLIKKFLELEIYEVLLHEILRVENLYSEYFRSIDEAGNSARVPGSYEDFDENGRRIGMTSETEVAVEDKIYDIDVFNIKVEALFNLERFKDIIVLSRRNQSAFENSLEIKYFLAESYLKGELLDQSKQLFESIFSRLKEKNEFYGKVARGIGIIAELNNDIELSIDYLKKAIPFLKDEEKAELRTKLEGLKNKLVKKM